MVRSLPSTLSCPQVFPVGFLHRRIRFEAAFSLSRFRLSTFIIKQVGLTHAKAQTGAVTLIQRFGSAANLNIHLHCLMLNGVYRLTGGIPVFQATPAPTSEQLQALLSRIITRLLKVLTSKGVLIEEHESRYLADPDHDPALVPLHSAACTYRIALGPRAGQKVLTWNI